MIQEKIEPRVPRQELFNYSKINLENFDNRGDIETIDRKLSLVIENLKNFQNDGVKLSYLERKLIYDHTKKDLKIETYINNEEYKDFIFIDMFKIILAPKINQDSYLVSRQLFGEIIQKEALLELLNTFKDDFIDSILKNDDLFKKNNLLLDGVKKEYNDYLKENKKEDIDNSIEDVLIFKYLYLLLFEYIEQTGKENYNITLGIKTILINEKTQFHIMFRHYFAVLKRNNFFISKSFFRSNIYFYDLFDFLNNLSKCFNLCFNSLPDGSIYFKYEEKNYKIRFKDNKNNLEKIITTFHPIDDIVDLNNLVFKRTKIINEFTFYYE